MQIDDIYDTLCGVYQWLHYVYFYLKSRVSYYNLNLMHTEQEYLYAAMNYNYANNFRK